MKRVFLGGTCNGSTWRSDLIKKLDQKCIKVFDPYEREICDYCLYVITPKMTGFYNIAEVVDDSNKRPEKTIFCFIETDKKLTFTSPQLKSLIAVGKMVEKNGGKYLKNLDEIAEFLNHAE